MQQNTALGAQPETRQDSRQDRGRDGSQHAGQHAGQDGGQGGGQEWRRGIPRGVLIIGIASAALTAMNVYASGIYAALACFDTCSPVRSMVATSPLALLVPPLLVAPSLALILVGWIWELIALRRLQRQGALIVAALAPLMALAVGALMTVLDAVSDGVAPAAFTAIHLWVGGFALTLWPLLVSVVAATLRERRPALKRR